MAYQKKWIQKYINWGNTAPAHLQHIGECSTLRFSKDCPCNLAIAVEKAHAAVDPLYEKFYAFEFTKSLELYCGCILRVDTVSQTPKWLLVSSCRRHEYVYNATLDIIEKERALKEERKRKEELSKPVGALCEECGRVAAVLFFPHRSKDAMINNLEINNTGYWCYGKRTALIRESKDE